MIMRQKLNGLGTPLIPGILGIALLVPASCFLLALFGRLCFGAAGWYYAMVPSFRPILGSVLLALLFNVLMTLRFRLEQGRVVQIYYKRHWLNWAIALQSALLLVALVLYFLVRHIR
jgi:hypothetical protein